jgi:hypothetical protein
VDKDAASGLTEDLLGHAVELVQVIHLRQPGRYAYDFPRVFTDQKAPSRQWDQALARGRDRILNAHD